MSADTAALALRKCADGPGVWLTPAPRVPAPGPGEVLVEVSYAGICGTDLHVDDWYGAYHFMRPYLPVTLGHEFSGHVRAAGAAVPPGLCGQRVVVRPSVTCGRCTACSAGEPDRCRERRGIGLTADGAFAPLVRVPARNCVPLPAGLRADVAALAEPFSIAWQALERAQHAIGALAGRRLLVLGPGVIGSAIALLARDRGAHVAMAGKDDAARCALLRDLGFEDVADLADARGQAQVCAWPAFDAVFEATGAPESIPAGLDKLEPGGVLVVTGIHPRPLSLDLTGLVRREHALLGSFRPSESVWPQVLQLLLRLQPLAARLVTHTLPLSQAQEAFDLARQRVAGKVMLMPQLGSGAGR